MSPFKKKIKKLKNNSGQSSRTYSVLNRMMSFIRHWRQKKMKYASAHKWYGPIGEQVKGGQFVVDAYKSSRSMVKKAYILFICYNSVATYTYATNRHRPSGWCRWFDACVSLEPTNGAYGSHFFIFFTRALVVPTLYSYFYL